MKTSHRAAGVAAAFAVLLLCHPVPADTPPPADPELLACLGELNGEDPLFIYYSTSREAKRAVKRAGRKTAAAAPEPGVPAGAVDWAALDANSQALLAGQADGWAALPPERQRALADGARHWLSLDGVGRAQANDRWQTWESLAPEQQERVRAAWARFRALTPEQQQAVRTAFLQFQELPQVERETLLAKMQRMSPEELRRAMTRRQGVKPGILDKRPCPPC